MTVRFFHTSDWHLGQFFYNHSRHYEHEQFLAWLLEQIKEITQHLALTDKNYPSIKDVDHKLIALVKEIGGYLITNDYNLNKVAELQGITVLNINELTNAVKVVVYPGETMSINVLKAGREPGQGRRARPY